jgi:hypothetical protein
MILFAKRQYEGLILQQETAAKQVVTFVKTADWPRCYA